jgi:hypothetical protein
MTALVIIASIVLAPSVGAYVVLKALVNFITASR